jgi:hypothetical protein
MAKALINSTNVTSVLEEHEARLDNLQALLAELLVVTDSLNDAQRGKKERSPEHIESMEYMVGLLEDRPVRDNEQPVPAPNIERHPEGKESSPDNPR